MRPALRFTLYLTVFATGAAGLIYQVVWQQYLGRIVGNEHAATAVILAVFLGGLAAGYLLSGAVSRRVRNPMLVYGILEGIIGVWAIIFPALFPLIDGLTQTWSFGTPGALVLEGAIVALLLMLVPTLCMGGTVPLLTRAISESVDHSTHVHARVYATNTLGAVVGALGAGFLFIPWLGLPESLHTAAMLNLFAAGFFVLLSRRQQPSIAAPETAAETGGQRRYPVWLLLAVAFLSGAYVMTFENVLIRVTDLALGPSTYSFALIVGVFVLCIGLGSLFIGSRQHLSPRALVWNQALLTLSLLALFTTLDEWPYVAHIMRVMFAANVPAFWLHKVALIVVLTLLLGIPVCLAGATLPIAFHELRRSLDRVGWHSGLLFFWNLVGAVAGSLIGGWLLYLWMGNGRIFLAATILTALSALLAAAARGWKTVIAASVPAALALAAFFQLPSHQAKRFAMGTSRLTLPTPYTWDGVEAFYRARDKAFHVVEYLEGPAASVAVIENSVTDARVAATGLPDLPASSAATKRLSRGIFTNGKADSDTYNDRETLRLLGDLASLFAQNRERVLVVGLGTGVTAAELALYPEWRQITVAEVLPETIQTLPLFGAATNNVHQEPRLDLRIGDAFRVLRRSPEKWDAIVSEPSHLWSRGTGQLFSRDFYRMVKERLSEGGVFVQWVQLYGVNNELLRRVGATLRSEFPHVTAFHGTPSDMLFVATPEPMTSETLTRANSVLKGSPLAADSLREIGIAAAEDLIGRREDPAWMEPVPESVAEVLVETLDQPKLHYIAGKAFFISDLPFNFRRPGQVKVAEASSASATGH